MLNKLFKWSTTDEDDCKRYLKPNEVAVPWDFDREEIILFNTADGYPVYKYHYTKVWVVDPMDDQVYPSSIELDFIPEINVSVKNIYLYKKNIK